VVRSVPVASAGHVVQGSARCGARRHQSYPVAPTQLSSRSNGMQLPRKYGTARTGNHEPSECIHRQGAGGSGDEAAHMRVKR
jgi:hypothetical protein